MRKIVDTEPCANHPLGYISMNEREVAHNKIGTKADSSKPRPTLLPLNALNQVIEVLEFGARKYSRDNWKLVPDAKQRYTDAMLRHALAYANGQTKDDESELHHLAHAVCCAMFILEFESKDSA